MNNSYQFFHLETYADKPLKNTLRPSAEAVARECQRVEKSFPHILNPQKPLLLYGVEPLEALSEVRELIKTCKDPLGRKTRSDAQIIAFGVTSIKVKATQENWNSPEVQKWSKDSIAFFKERFGDSFISCECHLDEEYIHLHQILKPKINDDGTLNLESFHPGLAAQRAVKTKTKSAKDHAYKEAMRNLQDEYFQAVGIKNGQLRYGPRRRRLTRKEWYAQKRYASLISKIFNEQSSLVSTLTKKLTKAKSVITKLIISKLKPQNGAANSLEEPKL